MAIVKVKKLIDLTHEKKTKKILVKRKKSLHKALKRNMPLP